MPADAPQQLPLPDSQKGPPSPNTAVMEDFTEVAATGITQILKLALVNRKLQEAHDLLLPRLMSGEIAV